MKCKKCGTEIKPPSNKCVQCGSQLQKRMRLVVGFAFIIIVPMTIYFFSVGGSKETDPSVPLNPIKTTDTKREEEHKAILNQLSAIPSAEKIQNKSEKEIESMLQVFMEEASAFYESYQSYTTFVSYNGFLYDSGVRKYIEAKDLKTSSETGSTENVLDGLILFVKSKDVGALFHQSIASQEFQVVVAYETSEGYRMASKSLGMTTVGKEDYESLLGLYKMDTSLVGTVYPQDQEYNEILKVLKEYMHEEKGFDIRTFSKSDLYAHVVLSPKEDLLNIQQYILKKTDEKWAVAIPNIEKYLNPMREINELDYNFNLLMLPIYNIYLYRDEMKTDFTSMVEGMVEAEYTTKADGQPTFQSGTEGFVYLDFATGKKFVGHRTEEGLWVMYPVQTYEEAAIMMLSLNDAPPLFILKQSEYR